MGSPRSLRFTVRAAAAAAVLLLAALVGTAPSARAQNAVSPDEQFEFANGLFVRGLYDLAVKEYMALVGANPPHPKNDQILLRLAESHRRLGHADPALFFFKRVITEYPQTPSRERAEFSTAEMEGEAGKFDAAVPRLTALLQRTPPRELAAGATYYLGSWAARQNQTAEAEKQLRAVLTQFADTPYASLAAIELAAILRKTGGREAEVPALYRAATTNAPSKAAAAEAWFQLGEIQYRLGKYDEAAAAFDRLLKDFADTPRAPDAALPAAWARLSTGRFADALALADAALKATPPPAAADEWLYLKANAHRQLHDAAAALAAYAKLRADFASSSRAAAAAYESALVAFQQKDFPAAIQLASSFEPPAPLREDVQWLLAESHAGAAHTNEAVQFYRLLADAPTPGPRAPDALYRLGRLLQDRGDFAAASELYRRLADRFPKHEGAAASLLGSGFCLAQLNRHADAVTEWTKLVSAYPDSPLAEEALFQKALGEYRLGREPQSRESLVTFLQRFPKSTYVPEARFWLAALLEKAGESAEAEKELRLAIDAKPKPEILHRAQFRLASLLHRAKRPDEAAALIQPLVGVSAELATQPQLVEWLARYLLDHQKWDDAEKAALLMTDDKLPKPWPSVGWYLTGRARAGRGDRPGAIEAYGKTAPANADDPAGPEAAEAAQRLGDLLFEDQRYDDAAARYEQAAARASEPAMAELKARSVFGLGRVAEAKEKWDEAQRYFLSVAILFDHPELSPSALYRAAEIFGRQNQPEQRTKTLQELKTRYPQSEWAKKAGG